MMHAFRSHAANTYKDCSARRPGRTATDNPLPAKRMTQEQFEQKRFERSIGAGTNQRYHQERAQHWVRRDRLCKILVGALAVTSLCLTVATMSFANPWLIGASLIVAVLSAAAAIALNVLPLGEWASLHNALFQRWTDLREEIDSLWFDAGALESDELVERLKQMETKFHRICGVEPLADDEWLGRCYAAEKQCRAEDPVACAS